MFSTNGENSKLIIMGRKNHKISIDGGQGWSDPTSYTQVKGRTTTTAKGQEVVVNSGALLAAYTTFEKNATVYDKGVYHYFTKGTDNAVVDNEVKDYNGGAISMHGKLKACAFYNSSIKNNHLGLGNDDGSTADFGGGLAITSVSGASAYMTEGIWFNKCTIMGNCCQYGHGGGVASYLDGGDGTANDKLVFRDTDFKYNCQVSPEEKHGGGLWHRDTKRKCQIYNSNFIGNYAHGLTAGGGGISNEGHLELESCTFDGNMADNSFGGGIYARPYTGDYVLSVSVKGCTFSNNQCTRTSDMESANCELDRGSGGAIMVALVTVHDCTANLVIDGTSSFTNNHADRNGGAIAMTVSSTFQDDLDLPTPTATIDANLELKNATISGNTCGKSGVSWAPEGSRHGYGGAIYLSYFNLKVTGSNTDVQAYNNSALEYGGTVGIYKGNVTMSSGTFGLTGKPNSAPYGGGFYVNQGSVSLSGGVIACNTASQDGGGVYVNNGTFNMTGGTIGGASTTDGNSATSGNGGGFYISGSSSSVDISGGEIKYNKATSGNGGGFYVSTAAATETKIRNTAKVIGNQAKNGGGAYINVGKLNVNGASVQVNSNQASTDGGGLYAKGAITVTSAEVKGNRASGDGGAIYADAGSSNTILIQTSAAIGGTGTGEPNTATNGAGIYAHSGTVTVQSDATVTGNIATGNGGGVFANGGTVNLSSTTASTAVLAHNSANLGGGVFADGTGQVNITKGYVEHNTATDGGAIYANGGTVKVEYANANDGSVRYNSASNRGGALFISSTGRLNLYGKTTIEKNHVPFGCLGGGVYLEGTVQAGNSSADVITVATNYADDEEPSSYSPVPSDVRNNIYLPDPNDNVTGTPDTWPGVISVVNNGLNLDNSSIGFSVPNNFIPVIYCKTASYLSGGTPNIMAKTAIFEDSERYTKYYSTTAPYDDNFIYLSADTWVQAVTSQPAGFSLDNIDSPEDLAWLISYVNNLNGVTGDNQNVNVTLTADIDMKAHSWVPIGMNATDKPRVFKGTFNGNGYTISNIYCSCLGQSSNGTGTGLGLIGVAENATIHDVFLKGVELQVANQNTGTYSLGAIANETKGSTSIYNCIAASKMESSYSNTKMGGLVGTLTNGTIHSSAATPVMVGYQMGGIASTNSGDIINSFANAQFTEQHGNSAYVGGLVAVNNGRVENCYARVHGTVPTGKFGYLVGNNTSTANKGLYYCYAPNATYVSTASGTTAGNQTGLSTFGITVTPYLYKHADNQVAAVSGNPYITNGNLDRNGLKGLLATLNSWVNDGHGSYASWMRTCASPINGDYPLFEYGDYDCVASPNNIAIEYGKVFNDKFSDYVEATTGTIYLYKTPAVLNASSDAQANVNVSNDDTNTKLYIHEDVALKPASSGSKAVGDIQAYVGITLDNSAGAGGATPSFGGEDAIDWHFFSSALADAPIGLTYGDDDQYNQYVYPAWHAEFTDADGYFPTNLNDVVSGDDYYNHWDLFAYYEPEYHWINLKRNSASHWHEDWPDCHIIYTNETIFEPGHGYLVALKEEGYLQGYGTLNSHSTSNPLRVDLDYTLGVCWTTRDGHNLLGNPYQSYLDFDAFATYNTPLWKDNDKTKAYYIIIDEDQQDYVQYAYGSSANPFGAGRYLHPHQGFMVIVKEEGLKANFDNRMRFTTVTGDFRDGQPRYPLVNLFATDGHGNRDMVTVELGRPDKGGAPKQQALRTSTGSLWCRYEDEDYAIVFTQPGLDAANIRFASDEDGEYTMTWSTHNGEFSYLHLIDNMTGADIDCLSQSEYTFSARESDYKSRFRLLFDYTGLEENEDGSSTSTGAETFAYYANGEIHLTGTPDGKARLQIIDMTGRTIVSRDGVHTVSTNTMAPGVYVLRLTDGNGTRIQKIILD